VEALYFDSLRVVYERGRKTEEKHYTAYGLKIAGISITKAGDVNEGELKIYDSTKEHLVNFPKTYFGKLAISKNSLFIYLTISFSVFQILL
jgi:hypothetical protein